MRRRRPLPPCAVGGGRRRGRSWRVRAGGSAFSSRRRRLPPGGRSSCRRQARPCSRDAPRPALGPGPRPTAQLAFVRPERAAANAAPRSSDGQHGAQDPARYAGSPAREAGAGVLLSLGDQLGDFRGATPALESSASSGLESSASWTPYPCAPGGWLCAPGRRVSRPGYLGDPHPFSPGFGQMSEGAAGAMLCAPSPLFQPGGADEGAWGAQGVGGGDWSRAPQGFRQPEPTVVWRLQLLRMGGALRGHPSLLLPSASAAQAA